jgi:two-component system, oxyanion-binding sensor
MRFAKRKTVQVRHPLKRDTLNVGFVSTIDCALIVAAQELGLYRKHGLDVQLSREVGWATIREKLLHEELDAAGAHASMLFSIYCGIGVVRRACLTGLMLGLNGSAITLSNGLWEQGVRDAASLGRLVKERKGQRPLTLGVVLELSSQNYNLREWLRSGGIDPEKDVRIAVIPSALVYDSFKEGYLDGYCVAEPWNSAAVFDGSGWVAAASSEVKSGHPEKVLLVLQEFAEKREEEHLRLIAALIEASEFCDRPANRPELARMLAQSRYFDVPEDHLANALVGPFYNGRQQRPMPDFVRYDAFKSGAPNRAMGKWVFDLVKSLGPASELPALRSDVIGKVFREDIFQKAMALVGPDVGHGTLPHGAAMTRVPVHPLSPAFQMPAHPAALLGPLLRGSFASLAPEPPTTQFA